MVSFSEALTVGTTLAAHNAILPGMGALNASDG